MHGVAPESEMPPDECAGFFAGSLHGVALESEMPPDERAGFFAGSLHGVAPESEMPPDERAGFLRLAFLLQAQQDVIGPLHHEPHGTDHNKKLRAIH